MTFQIMFYPLICYMKTLGLIGGTTWLSTIDYYRIINQKTNELMGGLNFAKILLYSVNFEEFRPPVIPSEWGEISEKFTAIAKNLEKAGADCIVFCANTPHIVADDVQQNIGIPIIHIAEAVEAKITGWHMKKVAYLGHGSPWSRIFLKIS